MGPAESKAQSSQAQRELRVGQTGVCDPYVVIVEDREDQDGEMRYRAIGYGANPQVLLAVAFADRSGKEQEIIRIISARKADDYEQRTYARQFTQGD